MIKYGLLKSLIIFCFIYFIVNSCYAQSLSSRELIENAKAYDGQGIVFEGEVIGDIMCRGQYCWVNLKDGAAAIGVWLPAEYAKIIKYKGSYKQRGDWLRVSGVFNRACPEHAGQLDIHAKEIEKIKEGEMLPQELSLKRRNLALILLVILCIVWISSKLKMN